METDDGFGPFTLDLEVPDPTNVNWDYYLERAAPGWTEHGRLPPFLAEPDWPVRPLPVTPIAPAAPQVWIWVALGAAAGYLIGRRRMLPTVLGAAGGWVFGRSRAGLPIIPSLRGGG